MTARATFETNGAVLFAGLMSDAIGNLTEIVTSGPGRRIEAHGLESLIAPVTRIAATLIGGSARPVRAVIFDKTAETN